MHHFDNTLSADSEADAKALNSIEWRKVGFAKSNLTKDFNGAQSSENREKQLKAGDVVYDKEGKQYLKLEKVISATGTTDGGGKISM